jgi:hypothetical protein
MSLIPRFPSVSRSHIEGYQTVTRNPARTSTIDHTRPHVTQIKHACMLADYKSNKMPIFCQIVLLFPEKEAKSVVPLR